VAAEQPGQDPLLLRHARRGQDAKSKLSLRGAAARSLRANGKAILTGTWMKGYITDVYWTAGWLLGFGSPLWPFPYRGGSARFLQQFGTYQYAPRNTPTRWKSAGAS
jgi:hypothetical protein